MKTRLDLLIKASGNANSLFNIGLACADISCRLKNHFSNKSELFFASIDDLVSKTENFHSDI